MLLYDIVEVGRQKPLLERAIRFFAGDKVVAKDFDQAVYLQKNKGLTNISQRMKVRSLDPEV